MADQEFLVSFGVDIDESGVSRLQAALEKNRQLADQLAAAFDRAREAVQSFFRELSEMSLPDVNLPSARVTEQQEGISLPFSLDFTKATQELNAFFKNAGKAFRLNADGSGIVSAGRNALSQLEALFASTVLLLRIQEEVSPGGASGAPDALGGSGRSPVPALTRAATGGRFSAPTKAEIAEDGDPEYVIPVKKESIAVPLMKQVIGELSEPAQEDLRSGLSGEERRDALSGKAGILTSVPVQEGHPDAALPPPREWKDALADLPDLLASASSATAPVIYRNTDQNVSAPVSIQVTAAAADPEAVGRSVYDVAEQYLLRTLKSTLS